VSTNAPGGNSVGGADAIALPTAAARLFALARAPRLTERGVGLAILVICAAASLIVPAVDPVDPNAVGAPALAPSGAHLFGTDMLGRDIFVRVFMAIRVDLAITLISVALSLIAGITVGLIVATLPKLLRELASRVIEAAVAIPYLVLALAIAALFGTRKLIPGAPPGAEGVTIALLVVGWMPFANLTVSQTLALRSRESIVAARVLGYSHPRILLRHIAPFVMSANISYAATLAVTNISTLAGLALLGVGIQQPTSELGLMIQQGIALLPTAPWIALIPGAVLLLLGIGFGLIADSYKDGGSRR
jgi:peptide/nickel transport system permease protein